MQISQWMSWQDGVDLMALTAPGLSMPNVIVHIAREVRTPVGAAPAGMILIPDFSEAATPPVLMGFVCPNPEIGAYFGPHIFAGTPFENAPILEAEIEVEAGNGFASAKIRVANHEIETCLCEFAPPILVNRAPDGMPFHQSGIEARANFVSLKVDGVEREISVPSQSLTGGHGAVYAAFGGYAR